jgi:small redox-active disulfide protein 2
MKKIQILGPGCPKCKLLFEHTKAATEKLGLECTIEKVTEIDAIVSFGILSTPALVVDGQVKVAGRVPSASQLEEILA